MVMVAPYRILNVVPYPVDAWSRLKAVVDQVSQAKADVVRFHYGLQSGPITMKVSQDKDSHSAPAR
jgi:hypothetical protein